MKIGILTLPIVDNYGGILQAVALYRLLSMQGNDVTLIYKETHQVIWKKILKEILSVIPFHNLKGIKTTNSKKAIQDRKNFHRSFIEKEIFKISKNLHNNKNLEKYMELEKFDAVIVGSDQVWRKAYINDKYYKNYFLDFVDKSKTKKIAYAASFGKDYWEGVEDIEEISKLLKDFNSVSTREDSGINICKKTFGYNHVKHVLDPTLLMKKDFYINEIISKYDTSNIKRGGLVTYVLDEAEEKREVINYIKNSLSINKTHHLKGFKHRKTIYTVPQWITSFAYADFVVTDSFHGMLFSIIFEKNFIVIGNKNRGLDRFTSLLRLLQLENRLIFNVKDIKTKNTEDINYNIVNKILDLNINNSYEYLKNSLSSN